MGRRATTRSLDWASALSLIALVSAASMLLSSALGFLLGAASPVDWRVFGIAVVGASLFASYTLHEDSPGIPRAVIALSAALISLLVFPLFDVLGSVADRLGLSDLVFVASTPLMVVGLLIAGGAAVAACFGVSNLVRRFRERRRFAALDVAVAVVAGVTILAASAYLAYLTRLAEMEAAVGPFGESLSGVTPDAINAALVWAAPFALVCGSFSALGAVARWHRPSEPA